MVIYIFIHSFIHSVIHYYSALEAGLAGTRAQSCDRYGSGTLHPGQVLGGSFAIAFTHIYIYIQSLIFSLKMAFKSRNLLL